MPELIRNGRVEHDAWRIAGLDAVQDDAATPHGPVALPLAALLSGRIAAPRPGEPRGVWLAPADDPRELYGHLDTLSLVAVQFPKFTDGRGYSTARLLRQRYGYKGEIRAVGYVLRDQLAYMSRCGFDAFEPAPGKDPVEALGAFDEMSVRYQPAVDEPQPIWRRR